MNNQITAALKMLLRIGKGRHEAKQEHGGRSPYIHSYGTFDKSFHRLSPLGRWLRENGIRDLERLDAALVRAYLKQRLAHHEQRGNCRKTFQAELSALAALERGLTMFSQRHRDEPELYDFAEVRQDFAKHCRVLPLKTMPYGTRTIAHPEWVIDALDDDMHRLMARLQWEGGCRVEGVGAPTRSANPFQTTNFEHPESGHDLGLVDDPVTGLTAAPFWTKEKGGKVAFKFCSPELRADLLDFFTVEEDGLNEGYRRYLAAVNRALEVTGQAAKGRGTHGLRYAFARRRYEECLRNGYRDKEAKLLVSQEMSHNRADITETYLGCGKR